MEYVVYIYMALMAFVLVRKGTVERSVRLDCLLFFSLALLSIIVRQNPHSDMLVYISNMKLNPKDLLENSYWIKNIVYWGSTRLLYNWGIPSFYVLVLFDLISFMLIIKFRNKEQLPYYIVPLFYVCFIGVFGFQNIYRQYFATILLLYTYSIISSKCFWGYTLFIVACLIHTSSVIILGALVIKQNNGAISKPLYLLGILVIIVLSPYIFATDYMYNTGSNYNTLYLIVVFFITIFLGTTQMLQRLMLKKEINYFQIPLYFVLIAISSFFTMRTSLYYERLVLFVLPFMVVLIVESFRFYKPRWFLDILFLILFMLPTFTFRATTMMLENNLILFYD